MYQKVGEGLVELLQKEGESWWGGGGGISEGRYVWRGLEVRRCDGRQTGIPGCRAGMAFIVDYNGYIDFGYLLS